MTKTSLSTMSAMLIALSLPLTLAAAALPGTISVAGLASETQANRTLKELQASAASAAADADQLRTLTSSLNSPDSQLDKLTALKGEVNRIGREISSLEAARDSLAPWQQRAVDQVLPLVRAAAANTEGAIEYFNAYRDRLWTQPYRDCTGRIWQDTEQIARTLKDYLKYDKLRDQELRVEERVWADSNLYAR